MLGSMPHIYGEIGTNPTDPKHIWWKLFTVGWKTIKTQQWRVFIRIGWVMLQDNTS